MRFLIRFNEGEGKRGGEGREKGGRREVFLSPSFFLGGRIEIRRFFWRKREAIGKKIVSYFCLHKKKKK